MIKSIAILLFILIFDRNLLHAQITLIDKNKVMTLFQNQQFDEVIDYVLPAVSKDSDNIELLSYLGYAAYMNDHAEEAEKFYKHIFIIDSNNISALQYLAILNKVVHTDQAVDYTRRLIKLEPNKAIHLRNLAELFKKMSKRDSAFLYYSQAYKMMPKDYKNAVGLAEILVDDKKFKTADSIIKYGLLLDSNNIPLLKVSIRSAYNADDYKNVLLPGERLMRIDEGSLTPLTQLFLSYYALKLYNDCIRVCNYLKTRGFLAENIFLYEAKSWAQLKQFKQSNELLNICLGLAISKQAEMYHYYLGLNYEEMKQYKKAITNYDTAYYLFKNPVMNYNAGRIAEIYLKNLKLAKKYYTEYLKNAAPTEADEKKAYKYIREKWGKKKNDN